MAKDKNGITLCAECHKNHRKMPPKTFTKVHQKPNLKRLTS